jgi:hypothetical protein
MKCYEVVLSYFEKDTKIPDGTEDELLSIKNCANELLSYVNSLGLAPICPLGGMAVRRDELCDFLSYNSEIMLRSIKENQRLPSGLRPLRTRDHW